MDFALGFFCGMTATALALKVIVWWRFNRRYTHHSVSIRRGKNWGDGPRQSVRFIPNDRPESWPHREH